MKNGYGWMKRAGDVVLSAGALIVLSPLFLALWLWVRLDSPGPALFRQKRVGKGKRYFEILKFRSMRTDTPANMPTHQLKNAEQYITSSGRFLRKSSLDELPQLINILKGDMSFVGPRPALWNQEDLLAERERYGANDVQPGLTGLAQIMGRDELPIPVKARYDGEYVRRASLGYDLQILWKTFAAVLGQRGVVEGEQKKP